MTAEATSAGAGEDSNGSKTFVNVAITGEPGGGEGEGWVSRKRRESPCAGSSRNVVDTGMGMDMDMGMEVEGGRGGEGGEDGGGGRREGGEVVRNITSFSPYAARLGSGTSPKDDVGR